MRERVAGPRGGTRGHGNFGTGTSRILAFPQRESNRACEGCHATLYRAPPHHRLCWSCFHWDRAIRALETLAKAMREVRR
jgi:hypothetical protein